MIINRILPRLLLASLSRTSHLSVFHPVSYSFCSTEWSRSDFLQKLDKQIQTFSIQMQAQDLQENLEYFKKEGWAIEYLPQKQKVQFSKSSKGYDVKVLSQIKANPPNDPNRQSTQPQDPESQKLNYVQIVVTISKQGTSFLTAQLGVLQGGAQLTTLHFSPQVATPPHDKTVYNGPEVNSLPMEIINCINSIFQKVGLSTQMMMNMVIQASTEADRLDLEWMKDLRWIIL